jgi:hypothetical protein
MKSSLEEAMLDNASVMAPSGVKAVLVAQAYASHGMRATSPNQAGVEGTFWAVVWGATCEAASRFITPPVKGPRSHWAKNDTQPDRTADG